MYWMWLILSDCYVPEPAKCSDKLLISWCWHVIIVYFYPSRIEVYWDGCLLLGFLFYLFIFRCVCVGGGGGGGGGGVWGVCVCVCVGGWGGGGGGGGG